MGKSMNDIIRFLQEVRLEFSKVIWPKSDEFVGSVLVVLLLVAFFAVFLLVVDSFLTKAFEMVFGAFGF